MDMAIQKAILMSTNSHNAKMVGSIPLQTLAQQICAMLQIVLNVHFLFTIAVIVHIMVGTIIVHQH